MSATLLDVSEFPRHVTFRCADGTILEMSDLLERHYDAIMGLAAADLVRSNDSFGFVMAQPLFWNIQQLNRIWDDPDQFVWFAGGWGEDKERYIANAARKMRPLLRLNRAGFQHTSTLQMRLDGPSHFEDTVPSSDNGVYPWGDFPYGGAVIVQMGNLYMVGAVSALTQIEDDKVARLILGSVAQEIAVHNDMFPQD
jgi:hypothetical protein